MPTTASFGMAYEVAAVQSGQRVGRIEMHLDLFMRCYWERDRGERVRLYGELVEATIKPTGFSWHAGDPMLRISPPELMTRDNLRAAQSFWRSVLLSND